jgi:hypothetical protein
MLGEQQIGDQVVARYTIANRGQGELVIDQIRSNCSCTGMEQEVGGQILRLKSLKLAGGEAADVMMRIAVRGVPNGAPMRNIVQFETNDPNRPLAQVEVTIPKVTGGIEIEPSRIAFGTVPVNREIRYVLSLRSFASPAHIVKQVTTTDRQRVNVRFLPPEDQVSEDGPQKEGTIVGRIEVIVNTARPGRVDGAIQVHLSVERRNPEAVPITGRVAALVESIPPSLVLPRVSQTGPVWSGNCLCRNYENKPVILSLESASPGLNAEVMRAEADRPLPLVRISCDPEEAKEPAKPSPRVVRLRARVGDDETTLEIPVICRP